MKLIFHRTFPIIFFAIYLIFGLYWATRTGIRHDHISYLSLWSMKLNGENPYSTQNPYGPIMGILGELIRINQIAPKIFMFILFSFTMLIYYWNFKNSLNSIHKLIVFMLILPFNFFVFNIIALWGLNDTLVASFVGLGFILISRRYKKLGIVLFSVAALLKIYVLILVFFFCINKRKFDFKMFLPFVLIVLLGYTLGFYVFGYQFLDNFLYLSKRSSSLLSILEVIKNLSDPDCNNYFCIPNSISYVDTIIEKYIFFLLFIAIIALYVVIRFNLDNLESANLGLFIILSFYQVVHPQFFLTWLLIYIPLLFKTSYNSQVLFYSFLPIVLFLQIFQFFHFFNFLFPQIFNFLYLYGAVVYFPLFTGTLFLILKKLKK
jgi:hypothetical protein